MLTILKYVIFVLGLLAAYVLIEHFIINRGEEEQTISETISDTGNAIVTKVQETGADINDEYVQPMVEEIEN
jgi:hypothetical protein